jgi:hypothetical protein
MKKTLVFVSVTIFTAQISSVFYYVIEMIFNAYYKHTWANAE